MQRYCIVELLARTAADALKERPRLVLYGYSDFRGDTSLCTTACWRWAFRMSLWTGHGGSMREGAGGWRMRSGFSGKRGERWNDSERRRA